MIKKTRGSFLNLSKYNAIRGVIPVLLANTVKNHFIAGFAKGGRQTDASRSGWKKRKEGARRNKGRALLIDTGSLRRDIQKRIVTHDRIVVGTRNVPYAIYHNEGTTDMPQREIIGVSSVLDKKCRKIIRDQLKKAL